MDINSIPANILTAIIVASLWTIPWKGIALWKSARNRQKAWFIAILVINTIGILEIIYLILFSKKKEEEKIEHLIG